MVYIYWHIRRTTKSSLNCAVVISYIWYTCLLNITIEYTTWVLVSFRTVSHVALYQQVKTFMFEP